MSQPLPVGYHLHEYHIESILGEGDLGITYLALDQKSNNKVVIKEYFPSELAIRLSDQRVEPSEKIENYQLGLQEFIKNNQLLAKLKHRNIALVFELFESHNTSYSVMKYEQGQTLAELLEKEGMLTYTTFMKLLPPLLSALKIAHKNCFLHLDISPAHIYLRKKNLSPLLFNFNNGIKISSTQKFSNDIYALGAVLYHAISGKPPMDLLQRQQAISQGQPDPLAPIATVAIDKHYSNNLLEGIDWALAVNEQQRPQLVEWSTFLLSDSPQQSFLLRQSVQQKIMVIVIIMTLIATGFGLKYLFSAKKPESLENQELNNNYNNNKVLLSLLKQPTPTYPTQIIHSVALPMREIFSLQGHEAGICVDACLAFSPDGRRLASGSWDHTIKIWNVHSGLLLQTLQGHKDLVLSIAFSPNGLLLASSSADSTIKLWDVNTGELLQTLTEKGLNTGAWISSLAFSPDGQKLAAEGNDNSIKLLNLSNGSLLRTFLGHENVINSLQFSPDGLFIASASADGSIKLWEVNSGHLLQTFTAESDKTEILSIAFSPDGLFLASGDTASQIKLWNIKSGKLEKTLTGHKNWVLSVIFSHDGRLLASGSHDYTIKLWDIQTGKLLETLIGHKNDVNSIAFSPDDSILASGSRDKTIKLWHGHGINDNY